MTKRTHEYELGHSDWELKRLATQARLVDPFTRQFLSNAGIVAGMSVLDIGSGAGDVSFLASELVGPTGKVVGVDRSPTAIAAATERASLRGLNNVSFRLGDAAELTFEKRFDAITGRYVLMFSADPTAMLKGIAAHLRPGGVVVFHEADWSGVTSVPLAQEYDHCVGFIVETLRKVGSKTNLGLGLSAAFKSAGLPAPTMGLQALVGSGENDWSGIDMIADLATTMAPIMEQMGVTTIAKLDPKTLYQRMRDEVIKNNSVVVGRYEVGAWART